MIRKSRKRCKDKIEKEEFDFNVYKEIAIYKYVNGEEMSRKEWRDIDTNMMFSSHNEWRNYIHSKYYNNQLSQLKEFGEFIDYEMKERLTVNQSTKIIITAIGSFGLSIASNIYLNEIRSGLLVFILVGVVSVLIIVILIIYMIFKKLKEDGIRQQLYGEYDRIIKELIKKKK